MPEEKVIKSGQITLPRLLVLAASGGLIALFVATGGIWLTIGYLGITLGLCVILYMIATDYGVTIDTVALQGHPAQGPSIQTGPAVGEALKSPSIEPRPKRKGPRGGKRRR